MEIRVIDSQNPIIIEQFYTNGNGRGIKQVKLIIFQSIALSNLIGADSPTKYFTIFMGRLNY